MSARRTFRKNTQAAAERAAESAAREKFQREKPSLEALLGSGECEPDDVTTQGRYATLQAALQALKRERLRAGQSLADVARRSGMDRAVVSRLENGKLDNPTAATLMRYAAALGRRFLWTYEAVPAAPPARPPKRRRKDSDEDAA
jgi:hypothetical protein